MEPFINEFEHLKIRLKEIKLATDNFADTKVIGSSGFGQVYKGELSHFTGRSIVAVKRLNRMFGQDGPEFLKEIELFTRYKHENLIGLLGFCDEGNEKILIYEYASNGALDRHLRSPDLTWMQRLKICIDTARGLEYLNTKARFIHHDIRSANILLDANWNAKISDIGLSKMVPSNQQHMDLFTQPIAGTFGYRVPMFERDVLKKESDVYAFGVVLFEVLCGRLFSDYCKGQPRDFVPILKGSYEQNKLQDIIFDDLKQQINQNSLNIFTKIAYKCLLTSQENRPTMSVILLELESALEQQELYERVKLTKGYKKMLMISMEDPKDHRYKSELTNNYKEMLMITAVDPFNNISEAELKMLLLKGVLLNKGKTWFSLNMDGEHCEMISIAECLTSTSESPHYIHSSEYISRFAVGCYEPLGTKFKTHVRTQFLSPRIKYTVNIVFRNKNKSRYIGLKYKLKGELSNSYSFLSDEREDGWLTAELYQFTSDQKTAELEIWFYTDCCSDLLVEGIEFQPLKKVEHEVLIDDKVDLQPILDAEKYWEQKLPSDYVDIIKRSEDPVKYQSKKDLYSILRKGFLISYGEEWFFLAKDGKKCLMLPARSALDEDRWKWKSEPETRFEEVADCIFDTFAVFCKFSSKMLSPQTTYATYLVYDLPDDYKVVDQPPPVQVVDKDSDSKEVDNIFLRTPQTPVISWNEKEEKTFKPSSRLKIKGLLRRRDDGWMEVQVHEFQTRANIKMISTRLKFSSYDMSLKGVIVQGVEFRPV